MSILGSLRGVAQWVAAVVGALVSVFALGFAITTNWDSARPRLGDPPHRLRWNVQARTGLPAGHLLAKQDLLPNIQRLPDGPRYVPTVEDAVGRYLLQAVRGDVPLLETQMSTGAAVSARERGAVLPVEVPTDHIAGLVPGMMLAFAAENIMLPSAADLAKPKPEPAFTLEAIGPSSRKAETTSLLVSVPPCRMNLAGKLGSGAWRPIILGALATTRTP